MLPEDIRNQSLVKSSKPLYLQFYKEIMVRSFTKVRERFKLQDKASTSVTPMISNRKLAPSTSLFFLREKLNDCLDLFVLFSYLNP